MRRCSIAPFSVHMNDPSIAHIIIGSRSCFTGTSSSFFGVSSLYEVVTHIVVKESQHVRLYTHFLCFKLVDDDALNH